MLINFKSESIFSSDITNICFAVLFDNVPSLHLLGARGTSDWNKKGRNIKMKVW